MTSFDSTAPRRDPDPDLRVAAGLEQVHRDATLHAWRQPGTSRQLVVCFAEAGVGELTDNPLVRSAGADSTANLLALADPAGRWFDDKTFTSRALALIDEDARRLDADDIVVIGLAGAARQALALASLRRVDLVLALSPRLPGVLPEPSLMRRRISRLVFGHAPDFWSDKTTYLLVFGDHDDDRLAVSRVPLLQGMNLVILPDTRRESLDILTGANLLDPLLHLACARRFMALRKHLRGTYRRLVFTIGGY